MPSFVHQELPEDLSKLGSISDTKTRYIALCLLLCRNNERYDLNQLNEIQDQFFAASDLRTQCSLIAQHQLLSFDIADHNAESLYMLINRLDACRRPQRFQELLQHLRNLQILSGKSIAASMQNLEKIVAEIADIKLTPDQLTGLHGKAIGAALEQLRLDKIRQLTASS